MVQKTLQITSLIFGGSSGGGAYNDDGKLIGMCVFRSTMIPGMTYFLHRDMIVSFLKPYQIGSI